MTADPTADRTYLIDRATDPAGAPIRLREPVLDALADGDRIVVHAGTGHRGRPSQRGRTGGGFSRRDVTLPDGTRLTAADVDLWLLGVPEHDLYNEPW